MQNFYRQSKNEKKFKFYDIITIVTIKQNNKKLLQYLFIKIKMLNKKINDF